MNQPAVVAIAGSCGTRDNFNSRFNPGYKEYFSCDLAANQTSMITMMSPPIEPVFEPLNNMSDYDRWNVASDMSREFLPLLAQLRPAYLVVDFFADIHFGVLRLEDGRYLTDNRWKLRHTDVYRDLQESQTHTRLTVWDDREEYVGLWREAMDRFAAHLAEHCPDTTVIVHRGLNVSHVLTPDQPTPIPLGRHKPIQPLDVPVANELWAEMDDYAVDAFGWESIDLRAEGYTSYAEHPWGAFYVHYTPDYYHRFLAELHKIHLALTVDGGLDPRLLAVEAAARESGDRRIALRDAVVQTQRGTLARQRQRIDELEGLGVLRSAKFALGQRVRATRAARTSRQRKSQES